MFFSIPLLFSTKSFKVDALKFGRFICLVQCLHCNYYKETINYVLEKTFKYQALSNLKELSQCTNIL